MDINSSAHAICVNLTVVSSSAEYLRDVLSLF